MKSAGIILLILMAFALGAFVSGGLLHGAKGATGIRWESSLNESMKEARAAKRPLLLDFYADWCGYCKQMDRTTYLDPTVIELSRRFVCVKVNTDKEEALTEKYEIEGLPTLVFLDSTGKEKKRVEGMVPAKNLILLMSKLTAK